MFAFVLVLTASGLGGLAGAQEGIDFVGTYSLTSSHLDCNTYRGKFPGVDRMLITGATPDLTLRFAGPDTPQGADPIELHQSDGTTFKSSPNDPSLKYTVTFSVSNSRLELQGSGESHQEGTGTCTSTFAGIGPPIDQAPSPSPQESPSEPPAPSAPAAPSESLSLDPILSGEDALQPLQAITAAYGKACASGEIDPANCRDAEKASYFASLGAYAGLPPDQRTPLRGQVATLWNTLTYLTELEIDGRPAFPGLRRFDTAIVELTSQSLGAEREGDFLGAARAMRAARYLTLYAATLDDETNSAKDFLKLLPPSALPLPSKS